MTNSSNVGFKINGDTITFTKYDAVSVNKSFTINIKSIKAIAVANLLRFDDDSLFLIFFTSESKPIIYNHTYAGDELNGFKEVKELLEARFNTSLDESQYIEDKSVLVYPEQLKGKNPYKHWSSSVRATLHQIIKFIGLKSPASGIPIKEISQL